MANIQERRDKNGKLVSFSIRVYRGKGLDGKQLKPWTDTFVVKPTWKEDAARRKAQAYADQFEKECKEGQVSNCRTRFNEYCDYVIETRSIRGKLKHTTVYRYKDMTQRIYESIGHLKLKEIQTRHLNDLYTSLQNTASKSGGSCTAKIDFSNILKIQNKSRAKIARDTGLGETTVSSAVAGVPVCKNTAQKICEYLKLKIEDVFEVNDGKAVLSPKTVLEYHRLIHTVLEQAVKEKLISYNPASYAELPINQRKEPQYYQESEVDAIGRALESEPYKWNVLVKMFLVTGARRGEILGMKWENVDLEHSKIHICANLLYTPEKGIYLDTPKTKKSDRWITIPLEATEVLRSYKAFQLKERMRLGEYYKDQGFVFARDDGKPIHPDSVTDWMNKFSKRHDLPHINPHAFRHTQASMLFRHGVDPVSVSHRLGHSKVSTTTDIYAHFMDDADQQMADIVGNLLYKNA